MAGVPVNSLTTEWVSIGYADSQFGRSKVELDLHSIKKYTNTPEREELVFQILHSKVRLLGSGYLSNL